MEKIVIWAGKNTINQALTAGFVSFLFLVLYGIISPLIPSVDRVAIKTVLFRSVDINFRFVPFFIPGIIVLLLISRTIFINILHKLFPLRILVAYYGSNNKLVNISHELQCSIVNGSIRLNVTNAIASDPAPGISKKMFVHYEYKGKVGRMILNEGDELKLP